MKKLRLHNYSRLLGNIKNWHLVVLLLIFFILSVYLLRQNSFHTIKLREEVLAADEKGEGVDEALRKLGSYIFSHMNTNIPPVELQSGYDRAVEKARRDATESSNSKIYTDAQKVCENPNIPLTARAQCIQDYVTRNAPPGSNPDVLKLPPKELYVYDFQAPVWTPDAAGTSLAITIILAGFLTTRLIAYFLVKQRLKDT